MILVFIFIACTCIYSVSTETVGFIQQPMTDKECHEEGDNGRLTLSFNVSGTTPLHNYIVALTVNPEGTGGFKSNGTELKFYVNKDRDIKHARYRVTMSYVGRTVEYRLDITALEYLDETSPLYAFIIESHSGKVMNKSSVGATFNVDIACPQRPQPTSSSVTNKGKGDSNQDHTSDPKEPSTVTAPPNNDITSTGNFLESVLQAAQRHAIRVAVPIGIFFLIYLGILLWLGIRRNPSRYSIPTI